MNALFDPRSAAIVIAGTVILALVFVAFLVEPQTSMNAVVGLVKIVIFIPVILVKLALLAIQIVMAVLKVAVTVIAAIIKTLAAVASLAA